MKTIDSKKNSEIKECVLSAAVFAGWLGFTLVMLNIFA